MLLAVALGGLLPGGAAEQGRTETQAYLANEVENCCWAAPIADDTPVDARFTPLPGDLRIVVTVEDLSATDPMAFRGWLDADGEAVGGYGVFCANGPLDLAVPEGAPVLSILVDPVASLSCGVGVGTTGTLTTTPISA